MDVDAVEDHVFVVQRVVGPEVNLAFVRRNAILQEEIKK